MIKTHENISLKNFNTFGIEAKASALIEFDSVEDLVKNLEIRTDCCVNRLILGGGSNILFTKDFIGIIYHPKIEGIKIVEVHDDTVLLNVGAGVDWDQFVAWCVNNNYYGVENLSLIPGNVGASPIQNIGAFGVEVKDVIEKVEVIDITNAEMKVFDNAACRFGYRDSVFKLPLNKNRYLVTNVYFRLSKQEKYTIHYGNLEEELGHYPEKTVQNIRQAIVNIRNRKLPDPEILGSGGSFFKNPVVSKELADKIKKEHQNAPYFPAGDETVKLAAGWLIDQCGWKGKRNGDAGVHKDQALVLVNYGNATGKDIVELAKQIQESVKEKFSVDLHPEVNII